jgi:catechol 2,3-dioxygenase-like lactoylglutathione lyase family enzyme
MTNLLKFNSLLPELYVSNFKESLDFYADILGFKLEYKRDNPKFGFLSYQGSQIMIQELVSGEKEMEKLEQPFGRGINFQIETNSAQTIIDALTKNNYPLKRGIKDSWYRENNILHGCREVLVTDPDGYLLRFSEDLGEKSVS